MGCLIPKPCAIGQITNLPLLTPTGISLRTEFRYCRGCFITANRIALTCALSTLKRACSASSSYAAFYISILQKGFRYLPQPCSGAVLVLHSHDSRRCTGYANRYSRPAQPNPTQPNPTQPENTPLAYCTPHSCCGHVYSEANGEIGGDKTASCYSVSPRCTALFPMNPVYCCKNAETLD